MAKIDNCIHDTFRRRNAGKVDAPFNSKPGFDNLHVDRSRLGTHEEWDETARNDYGGTGKYVEVPNDIRRNAIGAMGDLCAKSSSWQPDAETGRDTGSGPRCMPELYPPNAHNPMYKKRKGE